MRGPPLLSARLDSPCPSLHFLSCTAPSGEPQSVPLASMAASGSHISGEICGQETQVSGRSRLRPQQMSSRTRGFLITVHHGDSFQTVTAYLEWKYILIYFIRTEIYFTQPASMKPYLDKGKDHNCRWAGEALTYRRQNLQRDKMKCLAVPLEFS